MLRLLWFLGRFSVLRSYLWRKYFTGAVYVEEGRVFDGCDDSI